MKGKHDNLWIGVAILVLFLLICHPWAKVPAGSRGVVLTWDKVTGVMEPGLHARIPWPIQKVKLINVRIRLHQVPASCYSKDIQTVTAMMGLNYHVLADKVGLLYNDLGPNFEENIIDPALQEGMKAATAKFESNNLIEKREEVKIMIQENLDKRLGQRYVEIDEFSIIDFAFAEEYEKAILEKQVALQLAQKALNDLARIKTEADQVREAAKGESDAIRLKAQSLTIAGGAEYVQLQAIKAWKEGALLPTHMYPGGTIPFLNVDTITSRN